MTRLLIWLETHPEAVDLPEDYPCSAEGITDIRDLLAENAALREEILALRRRRTVFAGQ